MNLYALARPVLMALEAETAHRLTLCALQGGFAPRQAVQDETLQVKLWGRRFQNPLGLAAGFDKDATAIQPLFRAGFGFIEAGTVTPRPQAGNAPPRVFRDVQSQSIINRMGFPGRGLEAFADNVAAWRARYKNTAGILGVNIGINKDTEHPASDYKECISRLAPLADYIAVNISSPNTAGLRDLQEAERLGALLEELAVVRAATKENPPLLLKVAPDMDARQRADVAKLALTHGLDGLIVSNTTVSRPQTLAEKLKTEKGGLSGRLLADMALAALRDFYRLTEGKMPLIGVGGISSADDAYTRIRAGASLVQIYTGLVYQGSRLIENIQKGLAARVKNDGFSSVQQAVGVDNLPSAVRKATV